MSTVSTQCQQCFKRRIARCYLHFWCYFLFCILHLSRLNAGIITIGWRLMMQMRLLLIFSHLREAEWAEFALVRLLPAVVHKFSNFHRHFHIFKKNIITISFWFSNSSAYKSIVPCARCTPHSSKVRLIKIFIVAVSFLIKATKEVNINISHLWIRKCFVRVEESLKPFLHIRQL